jgi:two-component system sensor histidine kinase AlgZ
MVQPVAGAEPLDARAVARRGPEPLVPRWTALCYLLSPPLLAGLLHPEIFAQTLPVAAQGLLAVWIHTVLVGATLHALFAWVVPRVVRADDGRTRRLAVYSVAVVGGVVAALSVSRPIVGRVCTHEWRTVHELYTSLLISAGFVTALVTYQQMLRRVREIEQREQRAREKALAAELRGLQARTNPHFLFNALNTVAGLIGEDPRRAEDAVERLAELFRYTLDASRKREVPLGDELAAVRAYLEMETMRFEARLRWHIDVDPALERAPVPPLSIQPLVENAVLHGVEGRGEGNVVVEAKRDAGAITVRVSDDGPGPGRSGHAGTRTSLHELGERLRLLYGERATLRVTDAEGGGCAVALRLPLG